MAQLRDAAVVAAIVFAACIFGILTRPIGFLAAFWPANAVLLGMLVRVPRLSTPLGWLAAGIAFLAADLTVGDNIRLTFWLTAANMAMAVCGFFLFRQLPDDDRHLRRPQSVLYLFLICTVSALAAALIGAGAAPLALGRNPMTGFGFWFTTELVNSSIILPVILTAPGSGSLSSWRPRIDTSHWMTLAPVTALLLSIVVAAVVGGPGAIAFPVPALLWCALSYSLFGTAVLTFCVSVWQMTAVALNILPLPLGADLVASMTSIRLGIALLALGPLTVASVNAARNDVLRSLHHAASHDYLTDALSRSAFMSLANGLLARRAQEQMVLAVLMIDIDRFKEINDQFGHLTGDRMLVAFTKAVATALREDDFFARLGGDEFAVLLRRITLVDAMAAAELLRATIAETAVSLKDGRMVTATASIGMAHPTQSDVSLDSLLSAADEALYKAKLAGRNRLESIEHQKSGVGLPPASGQIPPR